MTDEEKENIKHRVSNIVDQVGKLALEYITDLEKENAELKKDKEWLDNTNNEQTIVILELQAQIEKMKCCGNCKNRGLDKYMSYPCTECKIWHREKTNDKWELEE